MSTKYYKIHNILTYAFSKNYEPFFKLWLFICFWCGTEVSTKKSYFRIFRTQPIRGKSDFVKKNEYFFKKYITKTVSVRRSILNLKTLTVRDFSVSREIAVVSSRPVVLRGIVHGCHDRPRHAPPAARVRSCYVYTVSASPSPARFGLVLGFGVVRFQIDPSSLGILVIQSHELRAVCSARLFNGEYIYATC